MRCLFIGGPNDGERYDVDTRLEVVRLPEYRPIRTYALDSDSVPTFESRLTNYIKVELRGETEQFIVYVSHSGYKHRGDTALTKLIEKYTRPTRS